MTVSDSFRSLADLIDRFEGDGLTVTDVSVPDDRMLEAGELDVNLTLRLPAFEGIDDDGAIAFTPLDADVASDGTVTTDVAVSVTVDEATVETEPAPNEGGSAAASPPADAEPDPETEPTEEPDDDPGEPPYKDPERLRAVYDEHDSFPAMREALGVDVSAQTVRRHMIDQGIHEPASSVEADASDRAESAPADEPDPNDVETTIADGIDLPKGISLDDIKETVQAAQTVHDVQARLGIDRERAKRLLTELNLIDLVCGRLADEGDRAVTSEEIEQRIRESAPSSA